MPSEVPASTRVAADAAAAKLRARAAALHPDEELTASIAANADAGDAFAHAYGALRELGLEDKVLDRFAMENATASEMRDAADILEQLARSEDVPGRRRKRGEVRVAKSVVRRFRVAAIVVALVLGLPIVVFGGVFLVSGSHAAREWWHARDGSSVAPTPVTAAPSPPLAPVAQGFETTKEGRIVPPRPRDYVADRAGILDPGAARALNGRLLQFERETSNQLVVFVDRRVPTGTTLEELGASTIRHWGVGQKGKDNGAILFVFVDDRTMRIEAGYGLESVLTDARSKRITSQIIKPLFRQERYAEGIEAGAQAIMEVTRGGDAALAAAAAPRGHRSPVPMVLFFLLAAGCLALAWWLARSLVRFLQGRGTFVFGRHFTSGGGARRSATSGGGEPSSDGSGSDSSGSYSGGGGSGGGGGASDSW